VRAWLDRVLALVIETGVVVVVGFTPFAFGGVHEITYTVVEVALFVLMMLWACRGLLHAGIGSVRTTSSAVPKPSTLQPRAILLSPTTYACAFACLAYLQTLPLPRGLVSLLSPNRVALDTQFRVATLAFHPAEAPESRRSGRPSDLASPPDRPQTSHASDLPISIYPYASRNELFKVAAYACVFVLITGGLHSGTSTRRITSAMVVVGAAMACLGLYQHFHWGDRIYGVWRPRLGGSPFGPYVNRNHFAGCMAMLIPLTIAQCLRYQPLRQLIRRKRRSRRGPLVRGNAEPDTHAEVPRLLPAALGLVLAFAMVTALFASLSRGGVTAFLAATSVFIAVAVGKRWGLRLLLIVVLVLALVWSAGICSRGDALLARFDKAAQTRPRLWERAFRIWRDFPLLGVGLACFEYAFPKYRTPYFADLELRKAHCDYLQALAEVGVVGTALIAAFLASVLLPAVRTIMRSCMERPEFWILVGTVASSAAILTHSVVDFNLQIPANALLFAAILGIAHNTARHLRSSGSETQAER